MFIQSLSVTLGPDLHHFSLVPQNPSGEPIIFQGPRFDERKLCRLPKHLLVKTIVSRRFYSFDMF